MNYIGYFESFTRASNAINSVLEGFAVLVCLMLNYAIVSRNRKTRLDQLFALVCVLLGLSALGDFFAWTFEDIPGTVQLVLAILGNLVSIWFTPAASTAFCLYVFEWSQGYVPGETRKLTRPHTHVGRVLWVAMHVLGGLGLLVVVINLFTGCLYTVNPDNSYTAGRLDWLPNMINVVQLLVLLPLLYVEENELTPFATGRLWLLAAGLPFFSQIVQEMLAGIAKVVTSGLASGTAAGGINLELGYPGYVLALFFMYVELQRLQERALMAEKLELAESRTQLLSGQIRSHFIFNSLAAIGELCYEDPNLAQKAIADFSTYLRGNMNAVGDVKLIPFDVEVSNIKSYVGLEQMNPTTPFEVEWDLQATKFMLPPLVVEPLVENAVVHGVSTRHEGGVIWVRSWEEDDAYKVSVRDNGIEGVEVKGSKHNGIAIENGRRRLALLCHGTLEAGRVEDGYMATVTIPKETE